MTNRVGGYIKADITEEVEMLVIIAVILIMLVADYPAQKRRQRRAEIKRMNLERRNCSRG